MSESSSSLSACEAPSDQSPFGAESAKQAPKYELRALDLLEGRIITCIGRVNKKARQVFRRKGNHTKVEAYRYNHLRRTNLPKADEPILPPS